uniref:tRNA pseudouridine synthase n=1 Tax=Oncorhynchus mykiss TaxID=8022 RepID=A0A8C7NTT2_ONCMY
MAAAAKRYEGTHDFRNLCKECCSSRGPSCHGPVCPSSSPYHAHCHRPIRPIIFEIKGLAFLYHQVRCMMTVLLLIGQKLEAPEIVDQVLDVERNPRKPMYSTVVDFPLVLFHCHFEVLSWHREAEEVNHSLATLQQHWTQIAVKTQVPPLTRTEICGPKISRFSSICLSLELTVMLSQPLSVKPAFERGQD